MMKNKHLQKLSVILSCAGLINSVVACGPETQVSREYSVELINFAGCNIDMPGDMKLTQEQKDLIENNGDLEWFKTLLDARFNSVEGRPYAYDFGTENLRKLCKINGDKITVSAVKQKFGLRVENDRVYINDPRFNHDVYVEADGLQPGDYDDTSDFQTRNGRSLRILMNLDIDDTINLHIDDTHIQSGFDPITITSDGELIEFCDSLRFLQELAEKRGESIQDVANLTRYWNYADYRYTLRPFEGKYVLTVGNVFGDRLFTRYSLFFRDESASNPDLEGVTTFSHGIDTIKFPEGSKMILEKIRFLEREYNFTNRFDVTDGACLSGINIRVAQVIYMLSNLSLPSFSAVWKNIDLSKTFSRTEKA